MNVESNGQRYLGKYNTPKSAIANRNRQSNSPIANRNRKSPIEIANRIRQSKSKIKPAPFS
jgi:hypothetical protein